MTMKESNQPVVFSPPSYLTVSYPLIAVPAGAGADLVQHPEGGAGRGPAGGGAAKDGTAAGGAQQNRRAGAAHRTPGGRESQVCAGRPWTSVGRLVGRGPLLVDW